MLTPNQCRSFDHFLIEQCGIPGAVLMENAGRNCSDFIVREHAIAGQDQPLRSTILCGGGNNGGDGFVIARHLVNAGGQVKVIRFKDHDQYSGDSKTMLHCLQPIKQSTIRFPPDADNQDLTELIGTVEGQPVHWIVDALLGTGAVGDLRPDMAAAVLVANQLPAVRFAVDVPSGLDPLTGNPSITVFQADLCGTFVASKTGFANPIAQPYLGKTVVLDIGFTPACCHWRAPRNEDAC